MMTASGTKPHVYNKHDLAISSRKTDFNVQISAAYVHHHCAKMFGPEYKFNLSLCYFL